MALTGIGTVDTPPNLEYFGLDKAKLHAPGFWASAHVPISNRNASAHHSDEEEDSSSKSTDVVKLFHSSRYLIIRQIPKGATEKDLEEGFAPRLELCDIQLQSATQSATAHVRRPELLEETDRYSEVIVLGQKLYTTLSATDGLLCVARLPLTCSDDQLLRLAQPHGVVNYAFVLRSQATGSSKGYGFVMFASKETALLAKCQLDRSRLSGCSLACDWVDPSHTSVRSLHSKCLHVASLPAGYKNMGEFRQIFSCVTNPPYCQIALKNGSPQDWGLVEFLTADAAERTFERLNGTSLRGSQLRLGFCMPGVRAIDIYMRLLNEAAEMPRGRTALLPDPTAPAVFQQLHTLGQQNPAFAHNLQNIIVTQIGELQQQEAAAAAVAAAAPSPAPTSVPPPPVMLPPPTPPMMPPFSAQAAAAAAAASQMRVPAPFAGLSPSPYSMPMLAANPFLFASGLTGAAPLLLPYPSLPPPAVDLPPTPPADPADLQAQYLNTLLATLHGGMPPLPAFPPVSVASGYPPVSAAHGFPPVSAAHGFPPVSVAHGFPPVSAAHGFPPVSVAHGFPPVSAAPGFPFLVPSSPITPQGNKRKLHNLLPSPEPSPENTYVGQHSQGIGGHYADSFIKRRRF